MSRVNEFMMVLCIILSNVACHFRINIETQLFRQVMFQETLHYVRGIYFRLFPIVVRSSGHDQNGAVRIACKNICSISYRRFVVNSY